jgi:hypothetical protein
LNYPATKELLNIVKELAPNSNIDISCTNKDFRGHEYQSDLVTIDETNHIGFEVLGNEIIVFYFSEHHHFEDYSSTLDEDEPDFIARTKNFLKDLFTCTIRYEKAYKGKTLISERYVFVHDDQTEDCPAGVWIHGLLVRMIPFLHKRTEYILWQYDIQRGVFVKVN